MDTIYVTYENGITADDWWMLDTYTTYAEAKKWVNDMCDGENGTLYKIVEYKFSRTMGLMM